MGEERFRLQKLKFIDRSFQNKFNKHFQETPNLVKIRKKCVLGKQPVCHLFAALLATIIFFFVFSTSRPGHTVALAWTSVSRHWWQIKMYKNTLVPVYTFSFLRFYVGVYTTSSRLLAVFKVIFIKLLWVRVYIGSIDSPHTSRLIYADALAPDNSRADPPRRQSGWWHGGRNLQGPVVVFRGVPELSAIAGAPRDTDLLVTRARLWRNFHHDVMQYIKDDRLQAGDANYSPN